MAWLGSTLVTILAFLLVFGIVVLVHELGHFLMARFHGVRVLEFGFGMPPRLWGIKRGDTVYSINLIPFGGFVRTYGQNDFGRSEIDPRDTENFQSKSVGKRSQIIVAGIVMNLFLAFVLLSVGYMVGMQPLLETTPGFKEAMLHKGVAIQEIQPEGTAAGSELKEGDTIIRADTIPILTNDDFSAYTHANAGSEINLVIQRDKQVLTIPVLVNPDTGLIGVYISNVVDIQSVRYPPLEALRNALLDIYNISALTLRGVADVFISLFTTFTLTRDIAGPIGIASITYQVIQLGFGRLVQFTALLSVTLACINVLPLPGLDGGHLLFAFIEGVRKRRVEPALEARIHLIGFLLVILFIIAVSIHDVQKLLGS